MMFKTLQQEDLSTIFNYLEKDFKLPVVILDHNLHILNCNKAFADFTGLKEKPIGYNCSDYLRDPDGKSLEKLFGDLEKKAYNITLASTDTSKQSETLSFKYLPGKNSLFLFGEQVIVNESSILKEFTILSNQFTNLNRELQKKNRSLEQEVQKRKQISDNLEVARAEAERENLLKRDFLARMSHEIRNPMGVIIGISDLLSNSSLNSEQQEYASMVKDSAESLLVIVNDILDYSKIEAGQMTLEEIDYDLRKKLKDAMEPFVIQSRAKGLELALSINPNVPHMVRGDFQRLRQVLYNLISNAIKFTEKGSVEVTVEVIEGNNGNNQLLNFTVKDSGIGIPEEKQNLLFKNYSQTDITHNRLYGGTGLGLAIAKQLVELMKGQIQVQSISGAGTTFTVTVPLKKAETKRGQEEKSALASPELQAKTEDDIACMESKALDILLVEDKPMNRKLVSILLNKMGWKTTEASGGIEALNILENKSFDLILMDIRMPDMDGLEVTKRIRLSENKAISGIPIIAMTAEAMKGDRERFLAADMDDYIPKPILPNELYNKVLEAVKKH